MHAISAPRREFGWTRDRLLPGAKRCRRRREHHMPRGRQPGRQRPWKWRREPGKLPSPVALLPGKCEPMRGRFTVRFPPPRPKRPRAQPVEKKEPSAVRYLALAREMKAVMDAEGISQAEIARRYALTRARVCQLMAVEAPGRRARQHRPARRPQARTPVSQRATRAPHENGDPATGIWRAMNGCACAGLIPALG